MARLQQKKQAAVTTGSAGSTGIPTGPREARPDDRLRRNPPVSRGTAG